jgi:hypothetical protein
MYAGTAKAASTWIYQCLYEHPDILMPENDTVNYFNINYHHDDSWYQDYFAAHDGESVVGEASTGYLEHPKSPERIAKTLPDVRLVFCLRNPIDRAFSQWWHGYSNGYITHEFEEIFINHPRFHLWAEPGFYAYHLDRFDEYFDDDQMKLLFFDDLVDDEKAFIQEIYDFAGVDDLFVPPQIGTKVNEADMAGFGLYVKTRNWIRDNAPDTLENTLKQVWDPVREIVENQDKYEEGIDPEVRRQIEDVFYDDVKRLSERTGRSLDHWFEYRDL